MFCFAYFTLIFPGFKLRTQNMENRFRDNALTLHAMALVRKAVLSIYHNHNFRQMHNSTLCQGASNRNTF